LLFPGDWRAGHAVHASPQRLEAAISETMLEFASREDVQDLRAGDETELSASYCSDTVHTGADTITGASDAFPR
jgi:hypothetical protein